MRLFVAVEPAEHVRRAAAAAAARLRASLAAKQSGDGIRWVPEENLHLTVWFLGELSDPRAAAVLEALRPPLPLGPFMLRLAGLGAFPPSGAPRVIWMGVAQGRDELARVHDAVGARLAPWGFHREGRPYSAHLTLARVKEAASPSARTMIRQLLRDTGADAGTCRIDSLTVFRSRTLPKGSAYEPLLRVPLV